MAPPRTNYIQKRIRKLGKAPSGPSEEKPKNKGGRPSKYSIGIAATLCREVATTARSLGQICKDNGRNPDFPTSKTVYIWLTMRPEFRDMYTVAKADQCQVLADELIAIADTPEIGQITTLKSDGSQEIRTFDMIEHRKLRVQARQWWLSKLQPRKYGERIQVDSSTDPLDELLGEFKRRNELLAKDPDAPA